MNEQEISSIKLLLETNPLWYQDERMKTYLELFKKTELTRAEKSLKKQFVTIFKTSKFLLSNKGYNWDQWRLPLECAVIHHTSSSPTISLKELNVLGLRLYINQYLVDDDVKNQTICSGHYWFNKPKLLQNMTFVSYHYLVRPNGKIIQMVDDSAFLWHAGNLDINRKSIGIALAGKFIDKEPAVEALEAVKSIIKSHNIPNDKVFGHCEVIKKELLGETTCPGYRFIESWKSKLF